MRRRQRREGREQNSKERKGAWKMVKWKNGGRERLESKEEEARD